jgi:signal transduction histidine kinase
MEKGKKYYEVAVADNGAGIPDELKRQLFRRFKTGDPKATGHGLGLYLAKAIVEDFGGRVQVGDRVPGDYSKGAKFVVLLPAAA